MPKSTRTHDVQTRRVPVRELHFDPQNPRLVVHNGNDGEILETMWREYAVGEVAQSIAANGFWSYEPLLVANENGRLVVIEGNRRLAAVKLLLDSGARERVGATDLPRIDADAREDLQTLPVIDTTREDAWQYVGFKHVNGPQAWQSFSKAQYIAWVHNNLRVPLEKIAETIGDNNATVVRLYRALMVLDQAERKGLWNREDRYKQHFSFSHLYVGLSHYPGIQKYLGFDGPPPEVRDPVEKDHEPQLRELMTWLYGSKSQASAPVVQSQNPHLRQLDQVLTSKNAVAAMKTGMPLSAAVDVAKGDAAKLREDLVAARRLLQQCRGKVLTGFTGEKDLLSMADEILLLAEAINEDMRVAQRRYRRRSLRRVEAKLEEDDLLNEEFFGEEEE